MNRFYSSKALSAYAVPFLSCFHFSSGLVLAWTFGVHLEPTFAPVLAYE